MENLDPLYTLQEMGSEQIGDDPLGVPEDIEQLRIDAVNVLEGRVDRIDTVGYFSFLLSYYV